MHRFSMLVVLAIALVGLGTIGSGIGASAQDGTPAAEMAGHPLAGAWLLDTETNDPGNSPTLATFTDDGIYTQVDADGSAGIGAWQATGPRTADMTFHGLAYSEDDENAGWFTVRAAIKVAEDGQTLTATYTLEFVGPDGVGTGQYGPSGATGTRINVEAMGTPVGSEDDLESLFSGLEASPEASPTT